MEKLTHQQKPLVALQRGLLGLSIIFFTTPSYAADPVFSEQSTNAGITFKDFSPSAGNMYAGVAWIDYDNDGDSDLFIPSHTIGDPNHFYHNNGDGSFTERAAAAGVDNPYFPYTSAVAADYNGDGCDDLLITAGALGSGGAQMNSLYRNNFCSTGNATFTNVTALAGLFETADSAVASFGDVDGDGDLDLYIGNYQASVGGGCDANHFYLNNGNGTFTEMANKLGIADMGCTLATVMTDFDNDGDLDIYVTNDFSQGGIISSIVADSDAMYRNLGPDSNGDPQFEKAIDINLTDAPNGMGIAVGDYDNDADLDYFATTISSSVRTIVLDEFGLPVVDENGNFIFTQTTDRLNRNDGGVFTDATQAAGVWDTSPYFTVSWGTAFLDTNNDGLLDLYKVSGSVPGSGGFGENFTQRNRLYMNNGDASFTEQAAQAGVLSDQEQGRGLAVADYDGDGDLDMIVTNVGERQIDGSVIPGVPQLFRNDTASNNDWLRISLGGENPNHRAVGAKLTFISQALTGWHTQLREIHAGSSHGSTHEYTAHFGIPAGNTPQYLLLQWPSGCQELRTLNEVNTTLSFFERNCDATFTLSGTISDASGNPVSGVQVQIGSVSNDGSGGITTTDSNGQYSRDVPNSSTYWVGPGLTGYTFTPVTGNGFVTVEDGNQTKDFTATLVP
ncbi:MAG TPA: hypothetical protein ENJ08_10110 [Gammaproteobacteria bacterium]|nr:hypothetical protein [Gammaproteobacteria bacterium]